MLSGGLLFKRQLDSSASFPCGAIDAAQQNSIIT
jgi:hypothetical protein